MARLRKEEKERRVRKYVREWSATAGAFLVLTAAILILDHFHPDKIIEELALLSGLACIMCLAMAMMIYLDWRVKRNLS